MNQEHKRADCYRLSTYIIQKSMRYDKKNVTSVEMEMTRQDELEPSGSGDISTRCRGIEEIELKDKQKLNISKNEGRNSEIGSHSKTERDD